MCSRCLLRILERPVAAAEHLAARPGKYSTRIVAQQPYAWVPFSVRSEITPPTAIAAWGERLLARPRAAATRPEK
jgi:hypothetical protein